MKKILSIVAIVFVALVVIGVVAGKKDGPAAPAAAPAPSAGSSPAPAASVKEPSSAASVETSAPETAASSDIQSGMLIDFGEYTIEITDVKIIPAEENFLDKAPTIAFWYTTTNVSKDGLTPMTAWLSPFEAYQDNDRNFYNKLEVAALPDRAHLDSQMAEMKIGGKLESSVAYVLDDLETPVILQTGKYSRVKYEQEFPVK